MDYGYRWQAWCRGFAGQPERAAGMLACGLSGRVDILDAADMIPDCHWEDRAPEICYLPLQLSSVIVELRTPTVLLVAMQSTAFFFSQFLHCDPSKPS